MKKEEIPDKIKSANKFLSNAGFGSGSNYTTGTVASLLIEYSDQQATRLTLINEKRSELIIRQKDYIDWVNGHSPEAKESRRGDNMLTDIEIINTALKSLQPEKPINKVTTTNLDIALRMCNIQLNKSIIDKILDLVELIEEKGDEISIKDICNLQSAWSKLDQIK